MKKNSYLLSSTIALSLLSCNYNGSQSGSKSDSDSLNTDTVDTVIQDSSASSDSLIEDNMGDLAETWTEETIDINELPATAERVDSHFQTSVYLNVEEEGEFTNVVSVWLADERAGTAYKICTTNPEAKGMWEEMEAQKGAVRVSIHNIAAADEAKLLEGDSRKLIIQGCPDARNIWSYLIDTESHTVMQLPGTEGVVGSDPVKNEIYIASYGYYPKGGRYSIIKAYSIDGKYLRDMTKPVRE